MSIHTAGQFWLAFHGMLACILGETARLVPAGQRTSGAVIHSHQSSRRQGMGFNLEEINILQADIAPIT